VITISIAYPGQAHESLPEWWWQGAQLEYTLDRTARL